MVTLCGFVIIGQAVSRFYGSEKHRDASFISAIWTRHLRIYNWDGVSWQDTSKRWTILESGTSDPLI